MSYTEIIESLPQDLRVPIARLVDALKEDLGVRREDFEELKAIVRDLAQAQQRTEERVEELAQAQQRTEEQVKELAQAQKRTEERVAELAQAQQRTEEQIRELAQAQKHTESALTSFQRTFTSQIGGLGARWGIQTEEAFRQGMRTILEEIGFTTERFVDYDTEAEVFGYPEQIELDVIVKNGKVLVVEIKSSLDKGQTYLFARKAAFYARKTGRQIDRKLIITPYADKRAAELAPRLGVEICTDVLDLR